MMSKKILIGALAVLVMAAGLGWRHVQAAGAVVTLTADDYAEIYDLYAKYTRACDMGGAGDGSDYAAVFTPDGMFGASQGPEALKKVITNFHKRLQAEGWSSRHTYTTILLTPTADGVKGSVYALIFNVTAKPPFVDHSGVYDDLLVKTRVGWRFKKRQFKNSTTFQPGQP
jgi:hypothetical protein